MLCITRALSFLLFWIEIAASWASTGWTLRNYLFLTNRVFYQKSYLKNLVWFFLTRQKVLEFTIKKQHCLKSFGNFLTLYFTFQKGHDEWNTLYFLSKKVGLMQHISLFEHEVEIMFVRDLRWSQMLSIFFWNNFAFIHISNQWDIW